MSANSGDAKADGSSDGKQPEQITLRVTTQVTQATDAPNAQVILRVENGEMVTTYRAVRQPRVAQLVREEITKTLCANQGMQLHVSGATKKLVALIEKAEQHEIDEDGWSVHGEELLATLRELPEECDMRDLGDFFSVTFGSASAHVRRKGGEALGRIFRIGSPTAETIKRRSSRELYFEDWDFEAMFSAMHRVGGADQLRLAQGSTSRKSEFRKITRLFWRCFSMPSKQFVELYVFDDER